MQPIERALDAALLVMRSGASTSMADRVFRNVLKGYGRDSASTAWRLDVVTASYVDDGRQLTVQRLVGVIAVNLIHVSESAMLSARMARREIDSAAFIAELERIRGLPSPYRHPAMTAAGICTAGAFSRLCGGDWGSFVISCLAAGAGLIIRPLLPSLGIPAIGATLVCSVLSACTAAIGLRLGLSQVTWITLISSVIYMAPGLPLINGFVDVVSYGHLLVGLERIANAVLIFLVLALGIAFAYSVIL